MSKLAFGIDFGTTNSSIAHAGEGTMELAHFPAGGSVTDAYRSILYLEHVKERGVGRTNRGADRRRSSSIWPRTPRGG